MVELKPCPFCGKHLELQSDHHGDFYEHPNNGCILGIFMQVLDDVDAEQWNARAPQPDADAGEKLVNDAIDDACARISQSVGPGDVAYAATEIRDAVRTALRTRQKEDQR